MSNTIDTSNLLLQLRQMAQDAGIPASEAVQPGDRPTGSSTAASNVSFNEVLQTSLSGVNDRAQEAGALRTAFEQGQPDLELTDVMVAVNKARISFEALTQVRNKMVSAYQEVMSMPL